MGTAQQPGLTMPDGEGREDGGPRGRALPGYYNDLDGSLAHAWAMLARGAADRRSAFHTPVVATVTPDGAPVQRIMVLRGVDAAARTLRFHTDQRAAKLGHIAANPAASVLLYDPAAKLQLRLGARAALHIGDATAAAGWAASRPQSRQCYAQAAVPGQPVADPRAVALPPLNPDGSEAVPDAGVENFAVLILTVESIEWLYLAIEGHRRARWTWEGSRWTGNWLAP